MTIVSIYLDRIEFVNAQYGKHASEKVIANAVSVLKTVFRDNDIVARVSEDQFLALVLVNMTSTKAVAFNARLYSAINDWNVQNAQYFQISVSVGLAI